jgi:hypothetical protein
MAATNPAAAMHAAAWAIRRYVPVAVMSAPDFLFGDAMRQSPHPMTRPDYR